MIRPCPTKALATVLLLAVAGTVQAAPLDDAELRAQPRAGVETSGSTGAIPARAAEPGKKETLDLLIEMQPKTPGLTFNERSRGERVAPSVPVGAARAEPAQPGDAAAATPPVTASGLFGSGAVDPAAAGRTETRAVTNDSPAPWQGPAPAAAGTATGARSGASGGDSPPVFAFTRAFVNYVRENREWFISGAVGALIMMWFASGGSGRRR